MKKKILVIGSNGMLGQSLVKTIPKDERYELVTAARHGDADYYMEVRDDELLEECIRKTAPDVVVNAAAIVDLRACEAGKETAYMVNARFPAVLSKFCKENGAKLVQISTEHYYLTGGRMKHKEEELPTLGNEYARTKYFGECAVLSDPNALVLRTNIVGFRGISERPTFIEWVIGEVLTGRKMKLFTDYFTSSIDTRSFSEYLLMMLEKNACGVYNLASSEVSSKKEFILSFTRECFGKEPDYEEAKVDEMLTGKSGRLHNLGLDVSRAEKLLGISLPGRDEVTRHLAEEYRQRVS